MSTLRVVVDGVPMPEAEARAFWKRFSDHMEANKGDLAGFAKAEGFASVHPAMGASGAELVVSRSAPQGPYRNVSSAPSSGSNSPQGRGGGGGRGAKSRRK